LTSDNRRQQEFHKVKATPDKGAGPLRNIGYVSGVILATGAAVAVGVNVSHRSSAATGAPIVSESRPVGSLTTASVGAGSSQVAQASRDEDFESKLNKLAGLSVQQDEEENGKADIPTFESVYGLVEDHYVDQLPDDTKMSRGAVRGMISSLNDPNSFFLEPEQRVLLDAEAHGKFAGIGAVTSIKGQKKTAILSIRSSCRPPSRLAGSESRPEIR
jgi:C-terminal processing protease CtpA/Prc